MAYKISKREKAARERSRLACIELQKILIANAPTHDERGAVMTIPGALESISVKLELRGPLMRALIHAAKDNGEEPITLLARSVDRMIERGLWDRGHEPKLLNISDFRIADAIERSR